MNSHIRHNAIKKWIDILFNTFGPLCRSVLPADLRFAETMDFRITPSTFLQFDIAMACDSLYGALYGVMLEYSVDMGQTWHPVVHQCAPPNFQCSGYHLSSEYMSDQHKNWTRVTLYMPPGAVLVDFSFDFIKNSCFSLSRCKTNKYLLANIGSQHQVSKSFVKMC